jgi:8-oxo-(d)GTP phosphatase
MSTGVNPRLTVWDGMGDHTGADVRAAGAVLWRGGDGGRPEVALVHRPRYDDWSLPKGKLDGGETAPAAAVREIAEETGYLARLGMRLGDSHYPVPEGAKVVHYWAAEAVSGGFAPNDEVDELRWVAPEAAEELVTHPRDAELVRRFTGTPAARPVLLVRHAKAGNRAEWEGDDDLRPLTGKGRRQADRLAALLPLFGPVRAYAAPPVRCPQTIRPAADALGLAITEEPLFGEHHYWDDPDDGMARLRALAAEPGVPMVCSQGGVIPDLVSQLSGLPDVPSRKASTWVLGFAGDRVVSADYYAEP